MLDRDNETWVAEMTGQAGRRKQDAAFQDLGNVLLPLMRWYLSNSTALPLGLSHSSYQDLDQLAQDIVQDSLVQIWEKGLKLYRREAPFLTYAKAVAINQARRKLRRVRRRREELWPSFSDDGMNEEISHGFSIAVRSRMVMPELSPEKSVALGEVVQCVDRILVKRCSPREREAFVRKYVDGLSSKEIAHLMDATDRAVDLLTFNARHKLRRGLEEAGYTLAIVLSILDA